MRMFVYFSGIVVWSAFGIVPLFILIALYLIVENLLAAREGL